MTWAWLPPVLYALSAVNVVLAWLLTGREPEHRPLAVALTVGLVSDAAIKALRVLYLDAAIGRLGLQSEWSGGPRLAGYVTDALSLAWPAAVAGATVVLFVERSALLALGGYAALVAALTVFHAVAGTEALARDLTFAELVCCLVALGCAVTWYTRSKKSATTAQACLMVVVAVEFMSLIGAWRVGLFANWHLTQLAYLAGFSVLILMQGGSLWIRRSSSR